MVLMRMELQNGNGGVRATSFIQANKEITGKASKDYQEYGTVSVLGKTKQTKILCDGRTSIKMHIEEQCEAAVKLMGAGYRTSKRRYFLCST